LLYKYDALRRLYDVQMAVAKKDFMSKEDESAFEPEKYVTLGQLGQAIELAKHGIPSVVLIDEIDKAEFDFPNDLLQLLEHLYFSVDEAPGLEYDALCGRTREERRDTLPLFIIASNRERELPRPFLRRCLYYYIEFPNDALLKNIIERHFQQGVTPLFLAAIKRFWQLRKADFGWRKSPSTSELLDWLHVLETAEQQGKLTAEKLELLPVSDLPFLETLIKTQSDRIAVSNGDLWTENTDNDDVDRL
jgi:MoxR-like ATPase